MSVIRGLSWAHTRGHAPMVATAWAWQDRHPGLEVEFTARSLADFAGGGLDAYVGGYDLVALDYPLIGEAVEHGWIEPLDGLLAADELAALAAASVGLSFASYQLDGRQWAAPLDAAALVSVRRDDLFEALSERMPQTFADVVALARRTGRVALPLTTFSCIATFLALSAELGGEPFAEDREGVVDPTVGRQALELLRELVAFVPEYCFDSGAVQLTSRMATTDDLLYIGWAYGYSVYARDGVFPSPVRFGETAPVAPRRLVRPTLGGVGLALLADAPNRDEAVRYLAWVTGADAQRGLFTTSGGQPAHAAAWDDDALDRLNHGFFSATRASIERAYVRPNAAWYGRFQPRAGEVVRDFLRSGGDVADTLATLDRELAAARTPTGVA